MSSQPPLGLVELGWVKVPEYNRLKAAGVRTWTDPQYFDSHGSYGVLVYVEPWVGEVCRLYRSGQKWAGLSDIDFIIATAPEKKGK